MNCQSHVLFQNTRFFCFSLTHLCGHVPIFYMTNLFFLPILVYLLSWIHSKQEFTERKCSHSQWVTVKPTSVYNLWVQLVVLGFWLYYQYYIVTLNLKKKKWNTAATTNNRNINKITLIEKGYAKKKNIWHTGKSTRSKVSIPVYL